ncbi:MAG: hypothetical protein BWY74_02324 [Firmicutes bacterium ADurb.Bin419]|nr:MAG: hypothetical protein BWY74_02324 [Firmicutes bacterium ADurb.Bin419]
MSVEEIGCCGAYCRTCSVFVQQACKGCKLGYENGERDISKAKCKIKVCCVKMQHKSCADCVEYSACTILNEFYDRNGYKYGKYKQATEYIKENGYDTFLNIADNWKNAHGKY